MLRSSEAKIGIRAQGTVASTKRLGYLMQLIFKGLVIKQTEKRLDSNSSSSRKQFFLSLCDPESPAPKCKDSIWMVFRQVMIEPYMGWLLEWTSRTKYKDRIMKENVEWLAGELAILER
mmetsp:Transcript_16969/g.26130  ORF Transcript_16969/g.26130 Transcript_16969/m.26130 type:complete len:119 (-) Transcript_16969:26-382(-)